MSSINTITGQIDLNPFCGRGFSHPCLHEPFSVGEYTYATDGRICVRVPRRQDIPEREATPDPGKLFPRKKIVCNSLPGDVIPALPPENRQTCPECDGNEDDALDCDDCDCRGYTTDDDGLSVEAHGAPFAAEYIRLMLTLPNVRIAKKLGKPREDISGGHAIYFCFDGGDGLIMGRTAPCSVHIRNGETYEQAVLEALRKDNLATVKGLVESGFLVGVDEHTFRIAEHWRGGAASPSRSA